LPMQIQNERAGVTIKVSSEDVLKGHQLIE
jgi:hypothetical protein